jgi:hypothetical protein
MVRKKLNTAANCSYCVDRKQSKEDKKKKEKDLLLCVPISILLLELSVVRTN